MSQTDLNAPDEDKRRALKSLTDWWALAGIEPLPGAAPQARRRPPTGSAEPARKDAGGPPAPAATPAAARAAGFARDHGEDAPAQDGRAMAAAAHDLDALKATLDSFEGCSLKHTARNLVFSRGDPKSPVMVVGEGPGREEDERGAPFVGRSGQLLDRMLAAIGLDPEQVYVSNVVFWRPPGNRKPTDAEIEACRPFAERHIELSKPKLLVFAGGIAAQTLLHAKSGIMSLRGRWAEYRVSESETIPALPVFHPAFLLRRPAEKARAWQDMISLQKRLETLQTD
ncbi:MAG: uracil-DNA glycosylase [Pseudomonadota bacterium]